MADDLNRLLIKIEADTSKLKAALRDAESGVSSTTSKLEKSLNRNQAKFKGWVSALNAEFLKLAAGYVGLQVVSKGLEAVDVVANLDDQARAAGVTSDAFQELSYAAKLSGASTEDLAQGLDKFSASMAQVRLNTGEFNQFLKDQAPALRDALAATTSQEQAVKVLSDAMAGLGNDSQRSTLLQQAFGKSSRDLVGVLSEGSRALANAGEQAHQFGLVLTNEDIEAAKQASQEFAKLETVLTTAFDRAAISAANFAISATSAFSHPITALGELIDKMNSMPGAVGGRGGARNPASAPSQAGPTLTGWDATVTKSPSWSLKPKPNNAGVDQIANLNKQVAEAEGQIAQALQDNYDQDLLGFKRMLDNKEISETQYAQARADLGKLMVQQTKENLGAETQLEKDFYTGLESTIDSSFNDAFSEALQSGKFKAADFFNSLLQGFAKVTTEVLVLKPLLNSLFAGVNGGGGLGSILNGVLGGFGGFLAAGGPADANTPYIVGEKGPELFVPNTSGRVKTAHETQGIITPNAAGNRVGGSTANGGSGGGIGTFIYNPQVDARGADNGVAQRLSLLAQSQAKQMKVMLAANGKNKRFPTR